MTLVADYIESLPDLNAQNTHNAAAAWRDMAEVMVVPDRQGARPVAEATARISRLEGMEGRARSADIRLDRYFPQEAFNMIVEG